MGRKTISSDYSQSGEWVHIKDLSKNETTEFVRMGGTTITRIKNGVPEWVYPDPSGSPIMTLDARGYRTSTEYYGPFGLSMDPARTNHDDNTGFTGPIK